MDTDNTAYDVPLLLKCLAKIVLVVVTMKLTQGSGFAIFAPFALFAIFRHKYVDIVFWLLVTISMMTGNSILMPRGMTFYIVNRGLLLITGFIMSIHLCGRKTSPLVTPYLGLLPYLVFMIVPSMLGWNPTISMLKLILFVMVFIGYCGIAMQVAQARYVDIRRMRAVILSMACFYIFGSILLIPFPGISQLSGEEYTEALLQGKEVVSLFKGIAMHSQALGPVVCAISVFLMCDMLWGLKRFDKLYVLLLICAPILIYKTSSRAGMFSFVLAIMFISFCFNISRNIGHKWRQRMIRIMWIVGICSFGLIAALPSMRNGIARFALKYNAEATSESFTVEEMVSSRQGLIDTGLLNFTKSPYIGNGFQVSESMANAPVKDWSQLISAPIEKGVWVVAILEEGGIFGFAIFAIFLVVSGWNLLMRRCYLSLSLFFTIIVSNMAEFTMFSMSGMGGFMWGMVFVGAAFDAIRIKQETLNGFSVPREW